MGKTATGAEKGTRLGRQDWVNAALNALAEGGVDAIRVEALAKRLKVTKGGFYWHFRDRADLHQALLEYWREGRMEVISRQTKHDSGAEAKAIFHGLLELYAGSPSDKGRTIELAIRDWARRDPAVAGSVVAKVDEHRLERVGGLFRDMGWSAEDAFARAYLFYAYVFGQSLLVPEPGGSSHGQARIACARFLIDEVEPSN